MGSQIRLDPALPERVHRVGSVPAPDAATIFSDAELLLVDDFDWRIDFAPLHAALVPRQRGFKGPFNDQEVSPEASDAIHALMDRAHELFFSLYPYRVKMAGKSFRPMITGPEPMHFDTYVAPVTITAFMNISKTPRVYNLGRSFPGLLKDERSAMAAAVKSCKGKLDDLSYHIRCRTAEGLPPLGKDSPRHRIEFAPGSIWFFNPKTVSHEVVYGEGALAFSWEVESAARSQQELLKETGMIN